MLLAGTAPRLVYGTLVTWMVPEVALIGHLTTVWWSRLAEVPGEYYLPLAGRRNRDRSREVTLVESKKDIGLQIGYGSRPCGRFLDL